MKLTHKFAEMTPEKRPQDPHMDGTGLRFETMEHGGEFPDTMRKPSSRSTLRVAPAFTYRSCKTVDSEGYALEDPEDEFL